MPRFRACRAAICIQQQLSRKEDEDRGPVLAPARKFGLASTPVPQFSGKFKAAKSTSITALGDTVNLASRLQAQAETWLCVDQRGDARSWWPAWLKPLFAGSFRFKGKTEAQERVSAHGNTRRGGAL